jgi:hypothetical protein
MRAARTLARGAGAVLAAATLALAGCAATPQATAERDAEAKRFIAPSDAGAVYVYRPDFLQPDPDDPVLYVGDRQIGGTLPRTFYRIDLNPGTHQLRAFGPYGTTAKIEVRSGELYFFALNVIAGGRSQFSLVNSETGQRAIRACCALMENWTDGPRTFPFIIR